MKKFTEIYNTAYNILADSDTSMMWDYLFKEVKKGNISQENAETMAEDIIDTYIIYKI